MQPTIFNQNVTADPVSSSNCKTEGRGSNVQMGLSVSRLDLLSLIDTGSIPILFVMAITCATMCICFVCAYSSMKKPNWKILKLL